MGKMKKEYIKISAENEMLIRNPAEIGTRLKEIRDYHELSQSAFADRIKIHQSSVALFEGGKRYLRDIYVKLICDEFDCSQDWLLYGVGTMLKKHDELTIEEYAEKYSLSPTDRDVIVNYMELSDREKKVCMRVFVKSEKKPGTNCRPSIRPKLIFKPKQ